MNTPKLSQKRKAAARARKRQQLEPVDHERLDAFIRLANCHVPCFDEKNAVMKKISTPGGRALHDLVDALRAALGRPLSFVTEVELHEAIADALGAAGIAFKREVKTQQGRVDFMIADETPAEVKLADANAFQIRDTFRGNEGSIPLEVKVAGSRAAVLRQIDRYATTDAPCVVLVSSLRRLCIQMPDEIHGKPLHVILARRTGGTL